jgi:hypothetical protein
MSDSGTHAFALLSSTHQDEFEEVCAQAISAGEAIIMRHDLLRVRVRDPHEEFLLLLALPDDFAQRCRVGPGRYVFPPEWAPEIRRIGAFHGIRASVVPSACFELDLWRDGALDALRAALLRRAPTFGPTYPRIAVA